MSEFTFVTPTWNAAPWVESMTQAAQQLTVTAWPGVSDPDKIHYVGAWLPPANVLRSFPNLKAIFSLGAGVDAILSDKTLPETVPIIRVNDPDLTGRMSEYIVWQVLAHHRQAARLAQSQASKTWDSFVQHAAKDITVGVMGLGVLGMDAAVKLRLMGFIVRGWSRNHKAIAGVSSFAGEAELDAFLSGTDILVCLLPATPETDRILNRQLFSKLSKSGPFGAGILINAGRGRQQVDSDILSCLDDGTLYAASLDVFSPEPLSPENPLWTHPSVTVTPHCAADSEPSTICAYIVGQIARHAAGAPFENIVNPQRGY